MTTVVEMERRIEPLMDAWDGLADAAAASPFLRPGWFAAWYHAFAPEAWEVLVARREGELVGVLPLHRRRRILRSATNVHTPFFEPLVRDHEALAALARGLFEQPARRISIFFLAPQGASAGALRDAAATARFRALEQPLQRSPYIALGGDFDAYEASLAAKMRREIRRRTRRLEEEGALELEVSDGSGDLDTLLDEGFRVEATAWKGSAGTAIASEPRTARFYRDLSAWARDRGFLRLSFLRHRGQPLAFDLSFETGGAHYLLKTGYDAERRAAGPGMIMRHRMIARAFERGLETYEFLGHDDPWKLGWTDSVRQLNVLRGFAPTPSGMANWVTAAHARPLAKRIAGRS